jgi:hypothetical protein
MGGKKQKRKNLTFLPWFIFHLILGQRLNLNKQNMFHDVAEIQALFSSPCCEWRG